MDRETGRTVGEIAVIEHADPRVSVFMSTSVHCRKQCRTFGSSTCLIDHGCIGDIAAVHAQGIKLSWLSGAAFVRPPLIFGGPVRAPAACRSSASRSGADALQQVFLSRLQCHQPSQDVQEVHQVGRVFRYRALPAGLASFSPMRCVAGSRAESTATWDLPSRPSATCASMPRSSSSNRSGSLQ